MPEPTDQPAPTPPTPPPPPAAAAARRQRRRRRWAVRILIALPLLLTIAVGVASQGPVAEWIIGRFVERATGARFSARWVSLKWTGRVEIADMRLDAAGMSGEAATLLRARRVNIDLDLPALRAGRLEALSIEVDRPTLRISQGASGLFNIQQLRLPAGGSAAARLPSVTLVDATAELGEHAADDGGPFTRLAQAEVQGLFAPTDAARSRYTLRLRQSGGQPMAGGADANVTVEGSFDFATRQGLVTLSSLELSKLTADKVPAAFRQRWSELDMRGEIAGTELRFSPSEGLVVEMRLQGVALTAPVAAGPAETMGDRRPRMSDVAGSIAFAQKDGQTRLLGDLYGELEDLRCKVDFISRGSDVDAAYRATIRSDSFRVEKEPRLLRYTPEIAQRNFERFSGPTAIVDALIEIERGEPRNGRPAPTKISGSMLFRQGEAAFEHFPYPLTDLTGTIVFDDDKLQIREITGRGPSGARLLAKGEFTPPTEGAKVDLRITVADIPFDEHLKAAVGLSRAQKLVSAIFGEERYAELLRRGLVVTPAQRLAQTQRRLELEVLQAAGGLPAQLAAAELAALEPSMQVPVFELGGTVNRVEVRVAREAGPENPYTRDIEIHFDKAGLVPQAFAYPLVGERVELKVTESDALLSGARFRGLTGGTAGVSARVELNRRIGPAPASGAAWDLVPVVRVRASSIPIDELLLSALPDDRPANAAAAAADPDGLSPQAVLRALGIRGSVDCNAMVAMQDSGEIGYDLDVSFDDLQAWPARSDGGPAPEVAAVGVAGRLRVTDAGLRIERIEGHLLQATEGQAAVAGNAEDSLAAGFVGPPRSGGWLHIEGESKFGSPAPGTRLLMDVQARALDLALPLEDLVGAVSADAAQRVRLFRAEHRPAGRLDADVRVRSAPPLPPALLTDPAPPIADAADPDPPDPPDPADALSVELSARNAEGLALDALGGRLTFERTRGAASVRLARTDRAGPWEFAFSRFEADVAVDGDPAGLLTLDGRAALLPERAGLALVVRQPITGSVSYGRLHSRLALQAVERAAGAGIAAALREASVRALFDADFRLAPAPGDTSGREWASSLSLRPWSVQFVRDGVEVAIPDVSGEILIEGRRGRIRELVLQAPQWEVGVEGGWTAQQGPDGALRAALEATLTCDARALTPDLLALMPAEAAAALRAGSVTAAGGMELRPSRLALTLDSSGVRRAAFDGVLAFRGLAADIGVKIREADGALALAVDKPDDGRRAAVRATLQADRVQAAGLQLTGAEATLISDDASPDIVVPTISADCFGGRLSGAAVLRAAADEAAGREYDVRLGLAGVRFADMLAQLRATVDDDARPVPTIDVPGGAAVPDSAADGSPPRPAAALPLGGDASRGWLDAELALSGRVGAEGDRRGRGSVRVAGGDVLRLPLVAPLLEISNLQIPLGDKLDYFHADFYLTGSSVVFEQLGLVSRSLAVMGSGRLLLPALALDLRFTSQSRLRIPLVSDLLEAARNEITTTRITGTLDDPKLSSEPLAGTRALIGGIFGGRSHLPVNTTDRARLEQERDRLPVRARPLTPVAE